MSIAFEHLPRARAARSASADRESGRGDRIRTCDLLVPNQALYQAKLRPDADAPDYAENEGGSKRFHGR